MDPLSFIMLRHVRNKKQNRFWNECYDCIRKFYTTTPIYIIDDNSPYAPTRIGGPMSHTQVINSEFAPGKGEVLPYYYYYYRGFSRNAIVLHDTVFINAKVDSKLTSTDSYQFLWSAEHSWDRWCRRRTLEILRALDSPELIKKYRQTDRWKVCFGGMAILNLEYVRKLFGGTNTLPVLIREVKTRIDRMCFERIIAVLLLPCPEPDAVMGDIHDHQEYNVRFSDYEKQKNAGGLKSMNKIWAGR